MKFKIVSDSSSNIFNFQGVDFESVPLKIITSQKEYTDDVSLDVEGMVEDLRTVSGPTRSSCPNTHEWLNAFEGSDNIFAITITSNLSGSYSAAVNAANEYMNAHPKAKVHVIDSLSTGPEMQLAIEKIAERHHAGDTFEEIKRAVCEYLAGTHLIFSLKSLTNLARNGRVSPAVAKIAGILGIYVTGKASDVGTLEQLSTTRGESKTLKTILSIMKDHAYRGGKVIIDHCLNEHAAVQLKQLIHTEYPAASIRIGTTKGLCSFYAESGGLMLGFEG